MGVGFDRGGPTGLPANMPPSLDNPLLSLASIVQGSMHPGYIVAASVTLGITAANATGFQLVKLTPGGRGPGDWNTEPGCFGFPKLAGYRSECGSVLVDTGIASAIAALPKSARPAAIASAIPNGEPMTVALPNTADPAFSYSFTTGDRRPTTPTSIRWAAGKAPFINTGRRLISKNDYLFDDGSGYVGFKPAS